MGKKWLFAGLLLAIVGYLSWQVFAPPSKATISKSTTYISAPLAEDGLPNYALAIIERQREGVTPENNGARLFWRALGPAGMDPRLYATLCEDLNIDSSASSVFIDVGGDDALTRLAKWIAAQREPGDADAADRELTDEQFEEARTCLAAICECPWSADQLPPAAEWIAQNDAALDLLVEAAAKPRFFSPSPEVLSNPYLPVVEMSIRHAEAARGAARSLAARAMNRVANRRYAEAWQDTLACWRLGARIGDGPTIVDKLIGIAMRNVAKKCTLALLDVESLPAELATQVLSDLNAQPLSLDIAASIDYGERLMFLDTALRQTTDRLGGVSLTQNGVKTSSVAAIDPNVPLKIGNQWYDRLAQAAALDDWRERRQALDQFDADIETLGEGVKYKVAWGMLNRARRSEAQGELLISLMLPAVGAAMDADERDRTNLILVRLAAALFVGRARTGTYPKSLDELAPGVIAVVPSDPYSGAPLYYELRGDGHLLYSVFQNGVDDSGSDLDRRIIEGEWVADDAEYVRADAEASDLVIRMPMPLLCRKPMPSLAC